MKAQVLFGSGLVIAALAIAPAAGAANPPGVDSILTKYVEALGGKAAVQKITSRILKIRIESESFAASEGEIQAKAPNKQWTQIELTGAGTLNEGFDGTVAWAKTPWEALRVKAGDELAKVKRDADFQRDLKLKTLYPDLSYKGTEKVGDEEAYVLESKPSATSRERLCFSAKTGLMVRQESDLEGPQGAIHVVLLPQDYKAVDGIKYPSLIKFKINSGGQDLEFTIKVLEIRHNVKVDDAKFAKPAA